MDLLSQIKLPESPGETVSPPAQPVARGPLQDAVALMGAMIPYSRRVEIFGEGEPAEYVYLILTGAVRAYKVTNDGRRQIGAFYLPGDVFGLQAGPNNRLTAEAISDSRIRILKQSTLTALAARDAMIARDLWTITARELERAQELALTLGRKTAQERVAGFLLDMAARARNGAILQLPMPRQDIADYLGLTMETVSRIIAQLEDASLIDVRSFRRVILRDKDALVRLSG